MPCPQMKKAGQPAFFIWVLVLAAAFRERQVSRKAGKHQVPLGLLSFGGKWPQGVRFSRPSQGLKPRLVGTWRAGWTINDIS